MPLNSEVLKTALKSAFMANLADTGQSQAEQVDTMAGAIATAMMSFVQSATITYTAGLVAPPSGGPVTGVFTNVIT